MAGTPPERRWLDLEERLGANWLNKIGTTAFVIGVALFLNYSMHYLGPAGKIAVGYVLSAALVLIGVIGERRERYRIAARAVLGGGWAIAYFTTYALHNVAAVHLVQSPAIGFVLLFVVAAAMVLHSLRYNSQVATGFAYLLGFASVAVSQITLATLVASAALAASLAVVLWRRRWYRIEPPAILATYALHWVWLSQVFEKLGGHKPFPEFKASVTLLTLYWLVWMASYFLRDSTEREARMLLTGSFVLNAGGYLAVLRYQSLYPELRFWFLLAVGVTYLALAPLAERLRRRPAFVLTTTFGATLLAAAIPYRYSGTRLEILWLVEAEAFLVAGWRLAETHLRKLGWAAAGALTIYVTLHDLSPRLAVWDAPDHAMGWMLLALAAGFYLNARFAPRLLRERGVATDTACAASSYVVATGFMLEAAWVALPFMWVALVWAIVAVALGEIGRRADEHMLLGCGHGVALFAAVRLALVNLDYTPPWHGISLRVVTMSLAVALFYLIARRIESAGPAHENKSVLLEALLGRSEIAAIYTWTGTLLTGLMVGAEFPHKGALLTWAVLGLASVAVAVSYPSAVAFLLTAAWLALPFMWVATVWAALALAVCEIGRWRSNAVLRGCGHGAALLAAARLLGVNLEHAPPWHGISLRLLSVSLAAMLFYLLARRILPPRAESAEGTGAAAVFARHGGLPAAYTWAATLLAALLAWNEVTNAAVGLAWAMLGIALVEEGRTLGDRPLRAQGHALLILSFARIFIADLNAAQRVGAVSARLTSVSLLAAIYYYAAFTADRGTSRMRSPYLWFGLGALAALARFELGIAWVAVAWAALAVIVYIAGRRFDLPPLRHQAYLLTLLVGARCALDNFYQVGEWRFTNLRTVTVTAAALLLYLLLAASLVDRRSRAQRPEAAASVATEAGRD